MKHIFLQNRNFRQITVNNWVSTFGDTIFYLAFINYVSAYSFAPTAIFLISLSETAPTVLSFFISSFADFQQNRIKKAVSLSFFRIVLYSIVTLILVSMKFSLLSVIFICLINFLSDLSSTFSGAMTSPIYVKIIEDDMTEAMGFVQATGTLVQVIGNFSGAILIGLISIEALAGINVLTFVFAFVGLLLIRTSMEKFESEMTVHHTFNSKNYVHHMIESIKKLLSTSIVMKLMTTSTMDNVVINSTFSIAVLLLIKEPFMGLATGQSISMLTSLFMVAMVLGNILTTNLFKNISLKAFILFSQVLAYLILLGYVTNNFWLILIGTVLGSFINGILRPRVQKVMWQHIPEEAMGAVSSAIGILDIVIPGILTMLGVWLATRFSILPASIFLFILLLISSILSVKTKY